MKTIKTRCKRIYILGILIVFFVNGYAQQDPLYTHFMFNKMIYNPAYTGVQPKLMNFTFLMHNQWSGFEGTNSQISGTAPTTQTFSIDYPFCKSSDINAMGLNIVQDNLGFQNNIMANVSFSAKKFFTFGTLFAGINIGAVQRSINNTQWITPSGMPSIYDPMIPVGFYKDILPDLGAGVYLASPYYYFGFSSQHIFRQKFNWGGSHSSIIPQSYVMGGLRLMAPSLRHLSFEPSFLYKIDDAKRQLDINLNMWYDYRFLSGIQLRTQDAASILLGMRISPNFLISYSYDITLTQMNSVSNGTHEVLLSYALNICYPSEPGKIIWTPRYL